MRSCRNCRFRRRDSVRAASRQTHASLLAGQFVEVAVLSVNITADFWPDTDRLDCMADPKNKSDDQLPEPAKSTPIRDYILSMPDIPDPAAMMAEAAKKHVDDMVKKQLDIAAVQANADLMAKFKNEVSSSVNDLLKLKPFEPDLDDFTSLRNFQYRAFDPEAHAAESRLADERFAKDQKDFLTTLYRSRKHRKKAFDVYTAWTRLDFERDPPAKDAMFTLVCRTVEDGYLVFDLPDEDIHHVSKKAAIDYLYRGIYERRDTCMVMFTAAGRDFARQAIHDERFGWTRPLKKLGTYGVTAIVTIAGLIGFVVTFRSNLVEVLSWFGLQPIPMTQPDHHPSTAPTTQRP